MTTPETPVSRFDDGYVAIENVGAKDKTILHSMKLDFPANSMTAILGPSGSGKTTLLNVLTDSIPSNIKARGTIHLPGASAFVPQDDRLHGFYTAKQYLQHYARLAGIASDPTTEDRIDKLLSQMGLSDQADTVVGDIFFKGLSGGQQRRLSIALEALTVPEILFLDEPTSGLDAESALKVMEFLQNYAREAPNRRVILTIHQPSSFIWETIDHVILLSKGRLMYNGPRRDMEDFFKAHDAPTPANWNPADHYVMAVNDEFASRQVSVHDWSKRFHTYSSGIQSSHPSGSAAKPAEGDAVEIRRQTNGGLIAIELTRRYFLNLAYNPGILMTRIAMYSMLALVTGALFWDLGDRNDFESVQSRIALLFYCVAFFIFMSIAVLPFTVMERAIIDKEVGNKYYDPIYYQLSQAISLIPGAALLAFLVTVLIICMTKLSEPYWYFLNMFLALVVAESLAQVWSIIVPHFIIGMAMVAGMYGLFMLLQGFMLVPSEFPDWLEWAYYVAFHTYSWRTFMYKEFSGMEEITGSNFENGMQVLEFYEIADVNPKHDMIVLVGYAGVLQVIACTVLYLRYNLFRGKLEPPVEEQANEAK